MTKTQISEILDKLRSQETYIRNDAIKRIIKEKINDEQVIVALKEVIENDYSMAVRNFARNALDIFSVEHSAIEEPRAVNSSNSESNVLSTEGVGLSNGTIERPSSVHKPRDVLLGFFGWFLVGNLLLLILYSVPFVIPLITIMVTVVLFMIRRNWFAYGIIAAVVTNTLVMVVLGNIAWGSEGMLLWLELGVSYPLPLGIGGLMY